MSKEMIYRDDAIDALCDNCDHVEAVCPHYPCKQYIAIENLPSAQPEINCSEIPNSSDTISRQLAIDVLDQIFDSIPMEQTTEILTFRRTLRELPSAQPEPQWIPCSERLPENNRQVLVYARSVHYALAKYDEMREADGTYKKQWVTFDAWKPFYTIKEVIAWMPLPEPYRGE